MNIKLTILLLALGMVLCGALALGEGGVECPDCLSGMSLEASDDGGCDWKCASCQKTRRIDHEAVDACTDTFTCAYCARTIVGARHDWDGAYSFDAEGHWRVCRNGCGKTADEARHADSLTYHLNDTEHWLGCDTCAYQAGMAAHTLAFLSKTELAHKEKCGECGYEKESAHDWGDYADQQNGTHSATCALPACGETQIQTCAGTPATCVEAETCALCGHIVQAALGHAYAKTTVKPKCTEKGYTSHVCARCQDAYTDAYQKARGHWYGEWTPNGDDTHTAACRRSGCTALGDAYCSMVRVAADENVFNLCPVCGATDTGLDSPLVFNADAIAVNDLLPRGELVVRVLRFRFGEDVICACFEYAGYMEPFSGVVEISLRSTLFSGCALSAVSPSGELEDVAFSDRNGFVSFLADFSPYAEEGKPCAVLLLNALGLALDE